MKHRAAPEVARLIRKRLERAHSTGPWVRRMRWSLGGSLPRRLSSGTQGERRIGFVDRWTSQTNPGVVALPSTFECSSDIESAVALTPAVFFSPRGGNGAARLFTIRYLAVRVATRPAAGP
ncbi:hypothetical protein MRX96_026294 [Rhipicephalus microplus]